MKIKWQQPTKEKSPFGIRTGWRSACGRYRVSRVRRSSQYIFSALALVRKIGWSNGNSKERYDWELISESKDKDEAIADCEKHRKEEHDLHRRP